MKKKPKEREHHKVKATLLVHCTDDEGCGWTGSRRNGLIASNGGHTVTAKPCPKCGKPVWRPPTGEKRKKYEEAKKLRAALPEEDKHLVSLKRGIVTKLDQGLIEKTADLIERGNFPVTAAVAAGIPSQSFRQYMEKGERDWKNGADTLYARLYLNVEQSRAIAEVQIVNMGLEKTNKNQSTWMGAYRHLESFNRDHWLKTQEVNINSNQKIEHSIDVPPDPPKSHEEWLRRRNAREVEVEIEDA